MQKTEVDFNKSIVSHHNTIRDALQSFSREKAYAGLRSLLRDMVLHDSRQGDIIEDLKNRVHLFEKRGHHNDQRALAAEKENETLKAENAKWKSLWSETDNKLAGCESENQKLFDLKTLVSAFNKKNAELNKLNGDLIEKNINLTATVHSLTNKLRAECKAHEAAVKSCSGGDTGQLEDCMQERVRLINKHQTELNAEKVKNANLATKNLQLENAVRTLNARLSQIVNVCQMDRNGSN